MYPWFGVSPMQASPVPGTPRQLSGENRLFPVSFLKANQPTTIIPVCDGLHHFHLTRLVSESQTCDDVSDGLYQRCEAGDFRVSVLPHRLPYNKATGQSEGEVRFLGAEKTCV